MPTSAWWRSPATPGCSTTNVRVADASRFAVGDVITIDMLDGPAKAVGAVQFNGEFMWFYDAQYFKRQPTLSWAGPSTGAPGVNVSDLAARTPRRSTRYHAGAR